jgi:hypothetical protein
MQTRLWPVRPLLTTPLRAVVTLLRMGRVAAYGCLTEAGHSVGRAGKAVKCIVKRVVEGAHHTTLQAKLNKNL